MNRKHNDNNAIDCLATCKSSTMEVVKEILTKNSNEPQILFLEPYYGGSHKQLLDLLLSNTLYTLVTLKPKKWPWRARCSALILSEQIPPITTEQILFCSSVLSLAELLGLRPDLNKLKKIVYFHENQFIYPIRQIKDRDIQFAYNQITTCLAADLILFNSNFNRNSLLGNLNKIVKLMPDYRPKNLQERIKNKMEVLYFPVTFPVLNERVLKNVLHMVWPHRWEFDKNPELFLEVLLQLKHEGCNFKVHILGEIFEDVPDIFDKAKKELGDDILSFGYVESKEKYYDILRNCHVSVSTAKHEFFGVSMLESAYCGCFPLVPNDLVYPEIYSKECLYKDKNDLLKRLRLYSANPQKSIDDRNLLKIDWDLYSMDKILPQYLLVLK